MSVTEYPRLPLRADTWIMRARVTPAAVAVLLLWAECSLAQQQPQTKSEELDVTMQIIVDPDAKLPDEVVRRIPLPAPKPAQRSAPVGEPNPAAAKGQERATEAKELGNEMSELAKQRAQEAAEQREQARRSAVKEERERGPPADPPGRPTTPPGR